MAMIAQVFVGVGYVVDRQAIQLCGTDFTLMEKLLPGRTRRQLKNKFK